MYRLKDCPRCGRGDLAQQEDLDGTYMACIQCGYHMESQLAAHAVSGRYSMQSVVHDSRPAVLLVGYSTHVRQLRRMAETMGYTAFTVRNAVEALNALKSYEPQLVVVDDEADSNVEGIVAHLRRRRPEIAVAILTGWWCVREERYVQIADYIIHKPLRRSEVDNLMRHGCSVGMLSPIVNGQALVRGPDEDTCAAGWLCTL